MRCISLVIYSIDKLEFAEDSVTVSLLPSRSRLTVSDCCRSSFSKKNISNTKEMVIDYGNPPRTISLTSIERRPVEAVEQRKFHGIVFDFGWTLEHNVDAGRFTVCAGSII